ncbi:MAG TPA: response regulator [Bacteroidota bacterium]|nr:response regulator [Bacteroidota bacterium]
MANKKQILFLEDEEELLLTVGSLLREQGYDVTNFNTAEDALVHLEKKTPDLILADIKLPGIDGFNFFKRVRVMKQCMNVPFVFLTAFNDLEMMMEAKKLGASEYITKPFDFEYLITRIKQITATD